MDGMVIRGTVSGWNMSTPGLVSVKFDVTLVGGGVGEVASRSDMFLVLGVQKALGYEFGKTYDFLVPVIANEDIVPE